MLLMELGVATHGHDLIPRGYFVGKVRPEMDLTITHITAAFS